MTVIDFIILNVHLFFMMYFIRCIDLFEIVQVSILNVEYSGIEFKKNNNKKNLYYTVTILNVFAFSENLSKRIPQI
jgi:hypothetical protein